MTKPQIILDLHDDAITTVDLDRADFLKEISHTFLPLYYSINCWRQAGYSVATINDYLLKDLTVPAYLISQLVSDKTAAAINKGAQPLILLCQESPYIATRFYLRLPLCSRPFKYSFVFAGMKKRLARRTAYRQMFFPQPYSRADFQPQDFKAKKFLIMISSAKAVGSWKKDLLLKLLYGFDLKEIYSERLRAIEYFSASSGFDLFGRGWDKLQVKDNGQSVITKAYRGPVEDKFQTLRDYKFTLCFENSIFPGYVTEKIFDAIFAGSVPIYLGAPDIKEYVPAEAFIDRRDFKDNAELSAFLDSIDEAKYAGYIEALRKFITSEAYQKFSQENFAATVIDILEKELV